MSYGPVTLPVFSGNDQGSSKFCRKVTAIFVIKKLPQGGMKEKPLSPGRGAPRGFRQKDLRKI